MPVINNKEPIVKQNGFLLQCSVMIERNTKCVLFFQLNLANLIGVVFVYYNTTSKTRNAPKIGVVHDVSVRVYFRPDYLIT